jgi:N-acetylglutamate synthase-like GNAT family acetyltransferase
MENINVTVYTSPYEQRVIDLILNIQQKEFGIPITLEQQPDLKIIPSFYQKDNGNFWIALHGQKVVGTIALIDIGNEQLALRKMFVDKDYRGKKYQTGQVLLDAAIAWMKERKCKQVFLGTIHLFEAAQKFYLRNGFEEVAKENLPKQFPPMKLDNIFFMKNIDSVSDSSACEIVNYEPIHQPWFEKFNRDWIEKYFWMEPVDIDVLQNPDEHIIQKGGSILMAYYEKEIAGTVALRFVSNGVYEFTKMAVEEKFRGKHIGLALAEEAIRKAKSLKAEKIILYSNTRLVTAITLYKKIGFIEIPVDGTYARSDIKMELKLHGK